MKKNLLVLMAIFCSLPLFAEFNLGVKGGYTSTLSFSNLGDAQWSYVDPRNAQGFHVGAFARFGNIIYFQPEVLYNREITKGTVDINGTDVNRRSVNSAVDVPLLFGWRIFKLGEVVNMRFVIGPKLRFNAGSKTTYETADGKWEETNKPEDKWNVATVGLDTGIGFEFLNCINLEMRYNLIGNLNKSTSLNDVTNNYKSPLNTFNIGLGIRF